MLSQSQNRNTKLAELSEKEMIQSPEENTMTSNKIH